MKNLKNNIRYSSRLREYAFRILKQCDKFALYNNIYNKIIHSKTSQVTSFPSVLSIETINLCNAKCTICAHSDMKRPKGKMDTTLVHSLIEQAGKGKVGKLFLSGFGEPLIDKRLPQFIEYAKAHNIENISIVTNGNLLAPELAQVLAAAGLNEINISIDGFTTKTYESIRLGLKFEKLVNNLKELSSIKNRQNINISLSCVDLIHNYQERHLAYTQFKKYVDNIYFRQAQSWTSGYGNKDARYSPHFTPNNIPCRYLWDSASIYIDGKVPACCLDYEAEGIIGNASSNSIDDIWQGEIFNNYRLKHLANKKSELLPCRTCGYYSIWW